LGLGLENRVFGGLRTRSILEDEIPDFGWRAVATGLKPLAAVRPSDLLGPWDVLHDYPCASCLTLLVMCVMTHSYVTADCSQSGTEF